tara:strand:- start:31 stop:579 length:549 start_codon:yes stop_codon:yes gene_type:complete
VKNFIIISAPSGSGKTSICKRILIQDKSIEFSVSCTTRARRSQEKNGIDYIFLNQDEFIKKINNKEFVEWEKIHGNFYYGTLKKTLDYAINTNKKLLLELDVKGAKKIMENYPRNYLSIFIEPPSKDELFKRLKDRGADSINTIEKRMERFESEMMYKIHFNYVIVNNKLNDAVNNILKIIN